MDDKSFYDLAKRVDSIEKDKNSWKNKHFLIPNFIALAALIFGIIQYFNVDPIQKRLNELEALQLERSLDKSLQADHNIEMALMTISREVNTAYSVNFSSLQLALDKVDKHIDYTTADKAFVHESVGQGHQRLGNMIKAKLHYDKAVEFVLTKDIDEKQFVRLQSNILSLYFNRDYFKEHKFIAEIDKLRLYKNMLSPDSFELLEGWIEYQSFYVALNNNKLELLKSSMKEIDNRFISIKHSIKQDLSKNRSNYTLVEKNIGDKVKSWIQVRLGSKSILGDSVRSSRAMVGENDS